MYPSHPTFQLPCCPRLARLKGSQLADLGRESMRLAGEIPYTAIEASYQRLERKQQSHANGFLS